MSASTPVAAPAAARGTRTLPDRLLGAVGAAMVILAIVLLIRGGVEDGAESALTAPPAVALLSPAAGAEIDGSLVLEFTTQRELERQPAGWGIGGFHLHLRLDGLELMPGPSDVQPLGNGRYRWTVGPLEPGAHRLQLYWSDARHAPVTGGESERVEVEAR